MLHQIFEYTLPLISISLWCNFFVQEFHLSCSISIITDQILQWKWVFTQFYFSTYASSTDVFQVIGELHIFNFSLFKFQNSNNTCKHLWRTTNQIYFLISEQLSTTPQWMSTSSTEISLQVWRFLEVHVQNETCSF